METIGFIGLGVMGKPMARNLLAAKYPLVVHNRSRRPVKELVEEGASEGGDPQDVASQSDVVVLMLPDTPDVDLVMRGPDGVLKGAKPGTLIIDMSTISPVAAREMAAEAEAKGCEMLDAPVSGGDVGACEGTLSIMVGGPETAFERAMPIFRVLGKNIVRIGESGAGQVCKACNQIVVAMTIQAVGEALVLAEKAGIDAAKVRDALLGGFAQSRILDLHGRRALERNFEPGFRARLHLKDLGIALEAGGAYGASLPGTTVASELLKSLVEGGRGNHDHSAIMAHLADLAGLDWEA